MKVAALAKRLILLLPPLKRRQTFLRELGAEKDRLAALVSAFEVRDAEEAERRQAELIERSRAARESRDQRVREREEAENLRSRLARSQQQVAELSAKLDETAGAARSQAAGTDALLQDLRSELDAARERLEILHSQRDRLLEEHERVLLQLSGLRARLVEAADASGSLSAAVRRLEGELAATRARLEESQTGLALAHEREREVDQRRHNYDSALAASEAQRAELEARLACLIEATERRAAE